MILSFLKHAREPIVNFFHYSFPTVQRSMRVYRFRDFIKSRIAQKRTWNGRDTSRNIQVRSRTPRNYQEDWTVKTKEPLYWSGWILSNRNAQCETHSLHQWTLVDYFLKPLNEYFTIKAHYSKVIRWINLNRSSLSI